MSRDPGKSRPTWFSHESCFTNLLKTIREDPQGSRVHLTVVFDGSIDEFEDDFMGKIYSQDKSCFDVILISGGSDIKSFITTLGLAKSSNFDKDDLVYFLENDYLHQHGWVSKVMDVYDNHSNVDYVSLYDHKDKYIYAMYSELKSKIIITATHHWRTAPSTCASFITSQVKLNVDFDVLSSGLTDYYFFTKLIVERGRILVSPIPGLSTHSMTDYLSPTIDWNEIAND